MLRRLLQSAAALAFALVATGACSSGGHATSSAGSGGGTTQASTSSGGTGGTVGTGGGGGGGGGDAGLDAPVNMCSAAIGMLLGPIDKVSTGTVSIIGTSGTTNTVYVDASAGGFGADSTHPRIYLDLATATKVAITDKQAPTSTAWDLALKRPVLFTNDGDGGPGMGGLLTVAKAFDQVTIADATGKFALESFVDASCNPKTDAVGDVLTTMSNWYDYDQATNILTPKPTTTFIVRGGTGKLYKLGIVTYYGEPDGGTGMAGGYYVLQIGAL